MVGLTTFLQIFCFEVLNVFQKTGKNLFPFSKQNLDPSKLVYACQVVFDKVSRFLAVLATELIISTTFLSHREDSLAAYP